MPRAKKQAVVSDGPPTSKPNESSDIPSEPLAIPYSGGKTIQCLRYRPAAPAPALIFTHGAGGTLNAPAMVNFAAGFAAAKPLLFFEGSMNLGARTKMFHAATQHQRWGAALGGRSMGARAAVVAAHEDPGVGALVLASYPLTSGAGEVRDRILLDLRAGVDVLFVGGDRDGMCEVQGLCDVRRRMKARSWLAVVRGADHGMNMRPKRATDAVGRAAGELAAKWLEERDASRTETAIAWDEEKGTAVQSSWSSAQARNGDEQSTTEATTKDAGTTSTAKKSDSGRKVVAEKKEKRDTTGSRKRSLKAETATNAAAKVADRPKRRKRG